MAEEYIFKRVSQERLKDIHYLYKECFGENVDLQFLKKKYDTSAFGADNIGFIAYSGAGEPSAYYGVFPCKAVIEGETYLCAQSGDTMTHPNHRGKGLFIKLANAAYELARQQGIQFVFGFPNENSYHGFVNKLGWTHKENLNIYKIKVLTIPLAYIFGRIKFLSGIYKLYSSYIIGNRKSKKKFFDNPFLAENSGGLLYDEVFFNYKNYYNKDIIDVNGKCVYIKVSGALRIGQIESSDEKEFSQIIKELKRLARLLGCYAIYFYFSPGVMYDKFLSSKLHSSKGIAAGWVDFTTGKDLSSLKFSQADLDTY